MQSIRVKHNCEMAHRLTATPGKCMNIHGHSWQVILTISGPVDDKGILLEFGQVKRDFRRWLDENYDHRVLLNMEDELVEVYKPSDHPAYVSRSLPGLQVMNGDPTTENFAKLVHSWASLHFGKKFTYHVEVWETAVNCATYPEHGMTNGPRQNKNRREEGLSPA